MKPQQWAALGAAVALAVILVTCMRRDTPTGGFFQPPRQPSADSDLSRFQDHSRDGYPSGTCPPHMLPGFVYAPHRYPRVAGGEITAAIHNGFSSMRVPARPDVQWFIAPPSEEVL